MWPVLAGVCYLCSETRGVSTSWPKALILRDPPRDVFGSFPYVIGVRAHMIHITSFYPPTCNQSLRVSQTLNLVYALFIVVLKQTLWESSNIPQFYR